MKSAIGIAVGFLLGFVCRYFDIPVPSPPKLLGAFLVVAVTVGYLAADRVLAPKPQPPTTREKAAVRSPRPELTQTDRLAPLSR
jgi:XapX domain-containing protein